MVHRIITLAIILLFLVPTYRLKATDLSNNEHSYCDNYQLETDILIKDTGTNQLKTKRTTAPHFKLNVQSFFLTLSTPCYNYRIHYCQLFVPRYNKHLPWSKSNYL